MPSFKSSSNDPKLCGLGQVGEPLWCTVVCYSCLLFIDVQLSAIKWWWWHLSRRLFSTSCGMFSAYHSVQHMVHIQYISFLPLQRQHMGLWTEFASPGFFSSKHSLGTLLLGTWWVLPWPMKGLRTVTSVYVWEQNSHPKSELALCIAVKVTLRQTFIGW